MVPKASQRAGGQRLATHLLNAHDNETVLVHDVRGAMAPDLHGAFAEWEMASHSTKCQNYLYSLSLNPDPGQRRISEKEYLSLIDRMEKSLGLSEQPRAVVFHVKNGRHHAHVVWSRIDTDKNRAIQLSNDRYKLRAAVREFTRENGLTIPDRMQRTLADRFNARASQTNLMEQQQQERTGISKEQRRAEITAAWRETDTAAAFLAALKKHGYTLAKGDSRAFVVVDKAGEVHSLSRQIDGATAKQIKARLADLSPDKLPTVAEIQKATREKVKNELSKVFARQSSERWFKLKQAQQKRREQHEKQHKAMLARHTKERQNLVAAHAAHEDSIAARRAGGKNKLTDLFGKLPGISTLLKRQHQQQDKKRSKKHGEELAALARRHAREAHDMARVARNLDSIDKREAHALKTRIQREQIIELSREAKQPEREYTLTPAQQAKAEEIKQTGQNITEPQRTPAISDDFAAALKAAQARRQAKKDKQKDKGHERGPGSR